MNERQAFWCECSDPDHQLVMEREYDDVDALMIYYRLVPQHHFWMRLKLAVRYLFKLDLNKCQYGDIVLGEKEISRLKGYLNAQYPNL